MQKLVGTVVVDGAPDGAEVFVDDRSAGVTPLKEPLIVDPGGHSIRVERDGYRPLRTEVTVPSGATIAVRAQLHSVAAWIKIACEAKDAVVHLDGKVVGGCPYEGEVQPGEHEVKVQEPGKPAFLQKFDVSSGGTATVAVTLQTGDRPEKEGGAGKPRGLLIGGIAALAVGAGAGVLGGVFAAKRADALDRYDALRTTGPEDEFNAAGEDAQTAHGVMIGGFVGAGVFLAAGVVLIVLDQRGVEKTEGDAGAVSLVPAPGGIAVEF
jgi:hypothetical protein